MKPNKPVRDADLDALLARRYRDTTPEFEARWINLKRELRSAPAARPSPWRGWTTWFALGSVAAALLVVASFLRQPTPPPAEVSPALAELFTMETVLSRGSALLDAESRDALLNLPVPPQPRI